MARRLGLLIALLLLAPATASAAPTASTTVKLVSCDAATATATWESSLRVSGASALAVRFTLQSRGPDERWSGVRAKGFGRWLKARPGTTRFVYDKTVTGLSAPSDYRVLVAFRWRDADGLNGSARRRSAACEQPDPRPDLRPVGLERGARGWTLTVANAGAEASAATVASLRTGDTETRVPVAAIEAGGELDVTFDRAVCRPGETLTATVDPDDAVDEADELGNAISVPCPVARTT